MAEEIPKLYGAVTRDALTHGMPVCASIVTGFKTANGRNLAFGQNLALGQAQKPVNVFLKVYVDWAKLPNRELAEKLTPSLHVRLTASS